MLIDFSDTIHVEHTLKKKDTGYKEKFVKLNLYQIRSNLTDKSIGICKLDLHEMTDGKTHHQKYKLEWCSFVGAMIHVSITCKPVEAGMTDTFSETSSASEASSRLSIGSSQQKKSFFGRTGATKPAKKDAQEASALSVENVENIKKIKSTQMPIQVLSDAHKISSSHTELDSTVQSNERSQKVGQSVNVFQQSKDSLSITGKLVFTSESAKSYKPKEKIKCYY